MLDRDAKMLEAKHSQAAAFIRAAELRKECHCLGRNTNPNPYQRKRLKELIQAPACQEPWFLDQLKHDFHVTPESIANL